MVISVLHKIVVVLVDFVFVVNIFTTQYKHYKVHIVTKYNSWLIYRLILKLKTHQIFREQIYSIILNKMFYILYNLTVSKLKCELFALKK